MDIKQITDDLISALKKYKSILICIKGSPDPDVIASSFALSVICSSLNIKNKIVSFMKPSLPQNTAFINDLEIPVHYGEYAEYLGEYEAYCVADYQSAYVIGLTGKIPCAVHFDHHEPLDEDIDIGYKFVSDEIGSMSTLITFIVQNMKNLLILKLDPAAEKNLFTALHYGIYIDTDSYRHACDADFNALLYISLYSDQKIIDHITDIPLPKDIMKHIAYAIANRQEYKGWILAGIGFLNEEKRDSIAIIADYLVQRFSEASLVVVFAGIKKKHPPGLKLDASFRTEDENIDLNRLIKLISATGGGRKYKGAYQVNLNYFTDCPDNDLLWNTIECTTINKLKGLRDNLKMLEIKGVYHKIKASIGRIIGV